LTDRGYDEGYDWRFSNSLGLYSNWSMTNRTENKNNLIVDLDEDVDTLLITPVDGDQYTIDWGVDNQITDLDICHPTEDLKATYFIGLSPERTRTFIANDKVSVIVNKTNTVNLSEVNVTLDIIADGTLDSDVNATIYVNASSYFEEIVGTYLLSSPLGRYVEINVDDSLASNLTSMLIRFYYSDSDVTAAGLVESLLRLHRYDGDTDTWVPLTTDLYWVFGSGVDTTNNYVWANTSKFSIYGIGEGTTTTTVVTTTTTTIYYRGGSSGGGGGISGAKPLPSCFDGIMNCHDGGCEEGVDCGGPCSPCMSCSDGIQNQGEEGIDCGGPCAPCQTVTSTTVTTTISPPSTIKSVTSTIETSTTTSMAEITTTTIQVKGGAFPMTTAVIIAEVIIIVGLIVFFVKVKGR
jgi:hypothetical protein